MDRRYWIAFNLVKGIGPVKVRRLLDHFGDLEAAWNAPLAALAAAGLDRRSLENLQAVRGSGKLDAALREVDRLGVQTLTWDDADYPRNLREIAQPPPVLYVKGALAPADEWAVAVVGTRHGTPYGREAARELSAGLAAAGVAVVSGLARGVDAIAHKAALDAGGRTLAVLGSGIDLLYPPEHAGLAEAVARQGAVISDYALGTPPDAVNFPPRNRIISGLSKGVLVVEAGEGSGALITSDFAAEQGRDVFAVPGSIFQRSAVGSNRLIQQGAKLVHSVSDVLEELNLVAVNEHKAARAVLPADTTEQSLLACLSGDPVHIDEIGAQAGLPISQVSGALALMELKGLVRHVGNMHYIAAREAGGDYTIR
ncbi:MAG: DNA-protecting protein DprA [Anaerolineales bacterium]|nr:DNA-protecting protein DprA [Anaerolineales bacterium]